MWPVTQTATPNTCWILTMWGRCYMVHSWVVKTINLSYIASEKQLLVSRCQRGDMKITFSYLCCWGSKGCKSLQSSHYSDGSACCVWRIVTFHQLPTRDAESTEKYFIVFQGHTGPATHVAIASAKVIAVSHVLVMDLSWHLCQRYLCNYLAMLQNLHSNIQVSKCALWLLAFLGLQWWLAMMYFSYQKKSQMAAF